jgi:hypothetical protein
MNFIRLNIYLGDHFVKSHLNFTFNNFFCLSFLLMVYTIQANEQVYMNV